MFLSKKSTRYAADDINEDVKSGEINIGINSGFTYSFTNKLDLECTFGLLEYSRIKYPNSDYENNSFKFALDLTASIRERINHEVYGNQAQASVKTGIVYKLSDKIRFDFGLGLFSFTTMKLTYEDEYFDSTDDVKQHDFKLNLIPSQITLAVMYFY